MDTPSPVLQRGTSSSPERESRFQAPTNAQKKSGSAIRFCGLPMHALKVSSSPSASPRRPDAIISPKSSPRDVSLGGNFVATFISDNRMDILKEQFSKRSSDSIIVKDVHEMLFLHQLCVPFREDSSFFIPILEIHGSINENLRYISENGSFPVVNSLVITSDNVSFKELNIPQNLPAMNLTIAVGVSEKLLIAPQKHMENCIAHTASQVTQVETSEKLKSVSFKTNSLSMPTTNLDNVNIISDSDVNITSLVINDNMLLNIETKGKAILTEEQYRLYEEGKITIEAKEGHKLAGATEHSEHDDTSSEASIDQDTPLQTNADDVTSDAAIAALLQEENKEEYHQNSPMIYTDNSIHIKTLNINTENNFPISNLKYYISLSIQVGLRLIFAALVFHYFPQIPFFVV